MSSCSGVNVKSSGMVIAPLCREFGLGHTFVQHFLAALVGYDQVDADATGMLVFGGHAPRTGDVVAAQDHTGESSLESFERRPVTQPVLEQLVAQRHGQ